MPEKPTDATVAPQVELAIRQLDSLFTLPCVATRILSLLNQSQTLPSDLAEIIESDPSFCAKIFSLMHQQGLKLNDESLSIKQALDKLPIHLIRDAVLSIKIYPTFGPDEDKILFRTQLITHCLAVACCARDIAEIVSPQISPQLAYFAGLLHDIGKLALDQAMPRSFAAIAEQAKSQKVSSCPLEQKHLGTDHTILGKRLAAKWHFPNQIAIAIWLHHSAADRISQSMPEARIAQVVQLADLIARQCGIGQSGSYDMPDLAEKAAQSLTIDTEQLDQIRRSLTEKVAEKTRVLGLDSANAVQDYYNIIHTTASQLAQEQTKLSLENRQLQTASSHLDFATDFLQSINSNASTIDVAENFAVRWQKFYQTGPVCLYLRPATNLQILEAVVAESPSQIKVICLNAPIEAPAIPQEIANSFAILDAQEYTDWLFEQLAVDFDLKNTKLAPLLSGGKAIGAIVFELRYPVEPEQLEEKFKTAASIAGTVLDQACACRTQQQFAEQFAQLITEAGQAQPVIVKAETKAVIEQPQQITIEPLDALAEMAGGAAHELNNPLLVISGRAQILAEGETDPEKKRMLEQIQENTNELSAIIDDLMTFAEPPQPRPTRTDVKQILDEAIQLAAMKTRVENIDTQIEIRDAVKDVFVDSAQIVSAIANIISNSVESYTDKSGQIKIAAETDKTDDFAKLEITDSGCGMDTETLQKATHPFFCSQPAGRKRGMGLAHAARLIQLNKGKLNITSKLGSGTTVTISLPCKG
jgi:putative nucleotidyltransferase with HDIG domain